MSLGPVYVFLGEVSVQVLCPFFNWVVCLLGVESCEFFITSVLNCASNRLAISSSPSCIFFWSFEVFCHLGLFFLSWQVYYLKGQSLRCSPGWGNPGRWAVMLHGGRGREGAMALVPLSTGFQSLPPLPTIKLGPSGAASRVGGFVYILGPCWSLQRTLL